MDDGSPDRVVQFADWRIAPLSPEGRAAGQKMRAEREAADKIIGAAMDSMFTALVTIFPQAYVRRRLIVCEAMMRLAEVAGWHEASRYAESVRSWHEDEPGPERPSMGPGDDAA